MKYRTKSRIFEAKQWFKKGDHSAVIEEPGVDGDFRIQTAVGFLKVVSGNWILSYENGQHSICHADFFTKHYEPIEE